MSIAVPNFELPEFDKRTSLNVGKTFPMAAHCQLLRAGSIAKDVCAQISTELVSTIPQIADYLCPVCLSLAYRTIRLNCKHIFCIRCVVKMQRRREKHCPMCRASVVMQAGIGE
jgi:E3 ubiquitin-protein ligase BAH